MTFPKPLLADSVTVAIDKQRGMQVVGFFDEGALTITHHHNTLTITIHKSLPVPLIVHHDNSSDLKIDIIMAKNASGTMIEHFSTTVPCSSTNITINPEANLTFYRLATLAHQSQANNTLKAHVNEEGYFTFYDLHPSSGAFSGDSHVELSGSGSACTFYGLDELFGDGQNNHKLTIAHKGARTTSNTRVRGIYNHRSLGVFDGTINLLQNAKGADAKQYYKALIVDETARAVVWPQMTVHEDDVKASHGATIGSIDADAMFYLRARGLSEQAARSLLMVSHSREIVDSIDNASLKTALTSYFTWPQSEGKVDAQAL